MSGQATEPTLIEAQWRRFSTDLKLPSVEALHSLEPMFVESKNDIRAN